MRVMCVRVMYVCVMHTHPDERDARGVSNYLNIAFDTHFQHDCVSIDFRKDDDFR